MVGRTVVTIGGLGCEKSETKLRTKETQRNMKGATIKGSGVLA